MGTLKQKRQELKRKRDDDDDNKPTGPTPKMERCSEFVVRVPSFVTEMEEKKDVSNPWYDMFPSGDGFVKVFICAVPYSGKTTLVWNILNRMINRTYKVLVFARHLDTDPAWKAIKELLNKRNVPHVEHIDFKSGKYSNYNLIRDYMQQKRLSLDSNPNDKFLIIIDDQGQDCRDQHLEQLLKTARHLRTSVIIASQSVTDLLPNQWGNLDYCLLFKGQPEKRLEKLHEALGIPISYPEFYDLYTHATQKPHDFFFVAARGVKDYRRNFCDRYKI